MTTILKNWHFMRLVRLAIAFWAISQAFQTGEWILLIPGGLFAMQAIFDVGCCGSAGCGDVAMTPRNQNPHTEEIIVEEVR